MSKKDYKEHTDRRLAALKKDETMRDLYSADPRDSAELAGIFFQMMVDNVNDHPGTPTAKLFREADLNPEHPFAWDYLLKALAEIHYNRSKGHPKIQDEVFASRLRAKIKDIVKTRSKAPTDRQLAILLQTRHGQDYPTITTVPGFTSLLKRHRLAAEDIWADSHEDTRRERRTVR